MIPSVKGVYMNIKPLINTVGVTAKKLAQDTGRLAGQAGEQIVKHRKEIGIGAAGVTTGTLGTAVVAHHRNKPENCGRFFDCPKV